uniref:Retrotransposon gag domain-containing protein n=1 Tax=Anopheles dirus TaxID=7168 RepID=A0A182NGI3_9DIPT
MEDAIDAYGDDVNRDIVAWFYEFEGVATMAQRTEDQKNIMCQVQYIVLSFAKDINKRIWEIVRASDVHRRLISRQKKRNESALEYVYEMQRIASNAVIDESSLIEYIVDGAVTNARTRASLYRAKTIEELKEELVFWERADMENSDT